MLRFFQQHGDRLLQTRNILDVGAGSGEFLHFCDQLNLRAEGIEPNAAYSVFARNRLGVKVRTAMLDDVTFPRGTFDCIRLHHVLEHVRDPVGFLARLREWLTDTGVLYVAVPDIDQDARRKAPEHLFHYGHIYNFNPWTLEACAGRAGFARSSPSYSTSLLFEKAEPWRPAEVDHIENALQIKRSLGAGRSKSAALWRLTGRLRYRSRELLLTPGIRSWDDVGRYFVDRYLA